MGNNGTSKTVYVSSQQKARHLAHGDQLGECTSLAAQVFSADANTLSAEQVELYPNPASQELNVQVNFSLSSESILSVHNFNGNTYMQIPVSGGGLYTIELDSRFIPGMYFIKISEGSNEVTKQFLVK
ncbi:MAG TPA: T9SS type A sorting domain-containing protein [Salinimicrobium catena]|uniref:T9SS type A sorting domain-containing protein n=1 Tax=Salinimicrobium catena TaxID=390640 RepID=A0A7C2M6V0_9FLAO|nr:T9SS type A sorting domain-containing protein [Salinimicrobium catena]